MVEQETWLTGISIHAPHARSDVEQAYPSRQMHLISIHAPHARSDATLGNTDITFVNISIHAPHARSDILLLRTCSVHCLNFNPRSSCEERPPSRHANPVPLYFNPRSSCEERRGSTGHVPLSRQDFNPRSSCEERRHGFIPICQSRCNFNPRSSCEERRLFLYHKGGAEHISIHAPHARSDGMGEVYIVSQQYFNPRSSCEERRCGHAGRRCDWNFNPRSSCEERPA